MRPSYLEINLSNISHNFELIKKFTSPAKIMAVVKANAYGHGLIECSKLFEKSGADFLGVAFIEEAIELRKAGIQIPIVTLAGISGRQINLFLDYDIDCLASSLSKLEQIESTAKSRNKIARIHVKIDTGMERQGVHYYSPQIPQIFSLIKNSDNIKCVGIASHFSDSESNDTSFMNLQLERFQHSIDSHLSNLNRNSLLHIANSGGILSSKKTHLGMIRPGRILYGISPAAHLDNKLDLKPALSLKSEVVYFKVVKKGSQVSYGRNWTAPYDTRVITVPLGYGDGLPRGLSSKGHVIIRGKRYPVIGNICMDQFMVDIGPEGEAYNGDLITVIGKEGSEMISVIDIASIIETEPLEVLTSLNTRLPRKFVN